MAKCRKMMLESFALILAPAYRDDRCEASWWSGRSSSTGLPRRRFRNDDHRRGRPLCPLRYHPRQPQVRGDRGGGYDISKNPPRTIDIVGDMTLDVEPR